MKNIEVKTLQEYFDMDKSKREFFGFYLTPKSLPCDFFNEDIEGWNSFYSKIRKQYPIQWFIRILISSKLHNIKSNFLNLGYKIKNFIKPCYPRWRKTLRRNSYVEADYLIVQSNFNIILDFYYEEVVNGYFDWASDLFTKKFHDELVKNVKWIEGDRNSSDYFEKVKTITDKETEILKWMIDNRGFFWS